MKNKFDLILNISVFVLGVIFIVLWSNGKGVFDLVSMAVGILFIVFSAWSLVALLVKRKDGVLPTKAVAWTSVPVVGSLALGIAMVAASSFFVEIFSYLFVLKFSNAKEILLLGIFSLIASAITPRAL